MEDEKNYYINLGKTQGLLPKSEIIPGETIKMGSNIKVYINKVDTFAIKNQKETISPRNNNNNLNNTHILSNTHAVISKIGGFLGFILIIFGLLELIGALPVNTDNKTGDIIIIGAGVLCYLIPIVIDEIINGLQNFSAWIMETVIDA